MRSGQSAFEQWMRSGRWPAPEPDERKFNPWHDPEDGRFTFAGRGRYFGSGGAVQPTRQAATRSQSSDAQRSLQERTRALRRRAQAEAAAAAERRRIIRERREHEAFRRHIVPEEGDRNEVYVDTNGFETVGIGHKVTDADGLRPGDRITDAQKEAFFRADADRALRAARSQMQEAGITDPSFLNPLASVNFQLGSGWKDKFVKAWPLIKARRYAAAAKEVEDSKWFREDTPNRVRLFQAALMRLESAERARRQTQRP